MSVAPSLRFRSSKQLCPICGGHEKLPKGEGRRCTGFLSEDGAWAHCSREEFALGLERNPASETYAHKIDGPCRCGVTHGMRPALSIVSTTPMREKRSNASEARTVVATYDYEGPDGATAFQVVRTDPKGFYQRRPAREADPPEAVKTDTEGRRWVNGITGITLYPYHLTDLLATKAGQGIVICEGEKDVDAARTVGLVATCNPMGAGKWRPAYTDYFRDRHVVVVADVDPPERPVGQQHARSVIEALTGTARSTVYLELPAHDFAAWTALPGSDKAAFEELVRAARAAEADGLPQFKAQPLADLLKKQFPPPIWAVPELIPHGLTLFAGDPKSGKSLLMLQICLAIACGGYALGTIAVKQGEVLYCDFENGEEILQERARQALLQADPPADFHYVTDAPGLTDGLLQLIETWKKRHRRCRLIVLDTFEAVRPPENATKGSNAYRADYAALRPLADLAKRIRVAIVVVHHLSKSGNRNGASVDDIFSHFNGSYGLNGAVDNLMALGNDGGQMVLSSRGRRGRPVRKALTWNPETAQWMDGGDPAEARQSDTRRQILSVLEEAGKPLYPSEIASSTGIRGDIVRQRLFHMRKSGDVLESGSKYTLNPLTHNAHNARNVQEENGVTTGVTGIYTSRNAPITAVTDPYSPIVTPSTRDTITAITAFADSHDPWFDTDNPDAF